MPFTPSHVAAALPFLRTPLIPAALVAGTVAPDIPYYVPLFVPRDLSHSLLGLVTIDPLIAVAAALMWWFLVRAPVIDFLPRAVGTRIAPLSRTGWRPPTWSWTVTVIMVILSAVVGCATHLFWDSFTHPGWVVDHIGLLRRQLGPLPLDKWLQHISTVSGLLIVAIWAFIRLRREAPDLTCPSRLSPTARRVGWIAFAAAGLAGGLTTWVHGIAEGVSPIDPDLVFLVARLGIAIAGVAAIALIVIWYLLRPRWSDPAELLS